MCQRLFLVFHHNWVPCVYWSLIWAASCCWVRGCCHAHWLHWHMHTDTCPVVNFCYTLCFSLSVPAIFLHFHLYPLYCGTHEASLLTFCTQTDGGFACLLFQLQVEWTLKAHDTLQKPAPEISAIGLNLTPDSGASFSCRSMHDF